MIRVLEKAIRAALVADATITSLVSTRIYSTQAPQEAALPYVVFSVAGGGDSNDSPRAELDVLLSVKCVGVALGPVTQVADAIRAALHDAELSLDAPWVAYRCQHTDAFAYAEQDENRQTYWHVGGMYRVRATG